MPRSANCDRPRSQRSENLQTKFQNKSTVWFLQSWIKIDEVALRIKGDEGDWSSIEEYILVGMDGYVSKLL